MSLAGVRALFTSLGQGLLLLDADFRVLDAAGPPELVAELGRAGGAPVSAVLQAGLFGQQQVTLAVVGRRG